MGERPDLVEIDLTAVRSADDLHRLLAERLSFPDFYGRNWDAFENAITGLVEMPQRLRLEGWEQVEKTLPRDAVRMRRCLDDRSREFPDLAPQVESL